MAEFELKSISMCSNFPLPDGKTLNHYLRTISKLDLPGPLRNRIIEIGEDNQTESQIGIGIENGGNPLESDKNKLIIDEWPEGGGHIHINTQNEHFSEFLTFYTDILEIVGQATLDPISYMIIIDKPFEDLNIGIEVDLPNGLEKDIHQVTGARFDLGDEDSDYLIQQIPNGEETRARYGSGPHEVDSDSAENLIDSELEATNDLIERL